jgi:hypothetical protein
MPMWSAAERQPLKNQRVFRDCLVQRTPAACERGDAIVCAPLCNNVEELSLLRNTLPSRRQIAYGDSNDALGIFGRAALSA